MQNFLDVPPITITGTNINLEKTFVSYLDFWLYMKWDQENVPDYSGFPLFSCHLVAKSLYSTIIILVKCTFVLQVFHVTHQVAENCSAYPSSFNIRITKMTGKPRKTLPYLIENISTFALETFWPHYTGTFMYISMHLCICIDIYCLWDPITPMLTITTFQPFTRRSTGLSIVKMWSAASLVTNHLIWQIHKSKDGKAQTLLVQMN